jgi:hypothetical protein
MHPVPGHAIMRRTSAIDSNIAQFFVFKSPKMKKKRKKIKKELQYFSFWIGFFE